MQIKDVVKIFNITGYKSAKTFGSGNINATYLVEADKKYLLQKMNGNALCDVYGTIQNIKIVSEHLRKKGERSLKLLPALGGDSCFTDSDGYVWRVYEFIPNSTSYNLTDNLEIVKEIAFAFGRFDNACRDLNYKKINNTDMYFHNTIQKYNDLEESIKLNSCGRVKSAEDVISKARNLISYALSCGIDLFAVVKAKEKKELPIRVVHNDTKLNNVLLDKTTNKYLAVVDLDTCNPGTILNDFGDGVRSNACTTLEDETNLKKVALDLNKFEAFTIGFLEGFGEINLTSKEKELLLTCCMAITFELGTRFLKDYLDGDKFFRIVSEDKKYNLTRAKVQFKLLEDMLNKKDQMQQIINKNLKVCN